MSFRILILVGLLASSLSSAMAADSTKAKIGHRISLDSISLFKFDPETGKRLGGLALASKATEYSLAIEQIRFSPEDNRVLELVTEGHPIAGVDNDGYGATFIQIRFESYEQASALVTNLKNSPTQKILFGEYSQSDTSTEKRMRSLRVMDAASKQVMMIPGVVASQRKSKETIR